MASPDKFIITPNFIPKPSKRRGGAMIGKVRFVVAHDTGNPNSTAAQNVSYYINYRNEQSASAHLFVDDKQIIECIPALTAAPEKAWHVLYGVPKDNALYGVNANDAAIGVEYCFGTNIDADKAYEKYVWTLAKVCLVFGLDPSKDIVGHFFLDPQRKTDPVTGLARSRRTYEQLLRDVVQAFNAISGSAADPVFAETQQQGAVSSTVKLNLRSLPSTKGAVVQTVPPNTPLQYVSVVSNGEPVNNNPVWYKDAGGSYFWSGGVQAQVPGNTNPAPAATLAAGLRPDQACIDFIKDKEGLQLTAYQDSAGVWTIGYGSILYEDRSPVRKGDSITMAKAESLLAWEVDAKSVVVTKAVAGAGVNQRQYNALVSFAYNTGSGAFLTSTLLKRVLSNPQDPSIRDAFMMWDKIHVDGQLVVLPGLANRRQQEADLYFS